MAIGSVLIRNTDGSVTQTAVGTAGHVLTSNGAGNLPTFQAGSPGTVTTTGSPANGNLTFFSGANSITNGNLSGAVTTSGTGVTMVGTIPGRLIGVQVITATGAGTYTPTSGTTSIVVELVGGGGGGGGAVQPGGSNVGIARGGAGGGYIRHRFTANFSGAGYVVGAKGTGGTAGNNNGNNGSDTTFTDTAGSPTTYTAGGGTGGTGSGGTGAPAIGGNAAGGTCTNGSIRIPGGASVNAFALSSGTLIGGRGGDSQYGQGAAATLTSTNGSNAGTNATGYGAGGSGATTAGSGAAAAGGDGSDGLIIIWEYS